MNTSFQRGNSSINLFLIFMIFLCFGGMFWGLHLAQSSHQARAEVLPQLFNLVAANNDASRQAIEHGALKGLDDLGLDSVKMTVSPSGTPLEVRLGRLYDNDSCPAVVNFIQKHPDVIQKTDVSFNGTLLTKDSQLEDLSCGGHLATSTLRVSARSNKV